VTGRLDWVFLDVGGVLYADQTYYLAVREALRQLGASMTDQEFEEEYERCRRAQAGSFRRRLAERFLGEGADDDEVSRLASRDWAYPPAALLPDARPTLEALAGRYRLGIVANQLRGVRDAMRRDGIDRFFEVWAVSEELGVEKPDPSIFRHALDTSGADPARAAMVGDRLDYDVRPARDVGMRTVWVLRGEAPRDPTQEQIAEPDAVIRSLEGLPEALQRL